VRYLALATAQHGIAAPGWLAHSPAAFGLEVMLREHDIAWASTVAAGFIACCSAARGVPAIVTGLVTVLGGASDFATLT